MGGICKLLKQILTNSTGLNISPNLQNYSHGCDHGVFSQILSPRARLHQSAEPDVLDLPAVAFPPDQQRFPFSGSG